ncbi:MAG TPA: TolC family protein [Desulfuromonadaceae bacterium]
MKQVLAISTVLFYITAGGAIAAPVSQLTLKDATQRALESNSLIKAARYRATAARQAVSAADSALYPHLLFEEDFAASNAPTQAFMMKLDQGRFTQSDFQINNLNSPEQLHNFKTSLSVQQSLYSPSVSSSRALAKKEADNDELAVEGVKQELAFLVLQIYLDIYRFEAKVKTSEQAVNEAKEHLRLAVVRNAAGVGLLSDELRAKTHLSSAEQQAVTALNNLMLARLQLSLAIGLSETARIELGDPLNWLVQPQSDGLLQVALKKRTDLGQAQVSLEKSELAVKLARSGYLPSLSAFASYQTNARDIPFGADNDAWLAGIGLKWNLFDGFRTRHESERAVANRLAAAEMLDDKIKIIRYQLEESYLRREEMGKRREIARHALQDAEETVRLLSRRFENSLATMADILDAQTALDQARVSKIEAESNWILAGGRIYYSAGILLEEMLR